MDLETISDVWSAPRQAFTRARGEPIGQIRNWAFFWATLPFIVMSLAQAAQAVELRKDVVLACRGGLTLYIGRIDQMADDTSASHVQMFDGETLVAGHLPFAPKALDSCRVVSDPLASDRSLFGGGWSDRNRAAGGAFTVSPREMRSILEDMLND